jgi:hypothetical protein
MNAVQQGIFKVPSDLPVVTAPFASRLFPVQSEGRKHRPWMEGGLVQVVEQPTMLHYVQNLPGRQNQGGALSSLISAAIDVYTQSLLALRCHSVS